jgi:hypothetical protein
MPRIYHSQMLHGMTPSESWMRLHPTLGRVCRITACVFLPVPYFGAMLAVLVFLSAPFQILRSYAAPATAFWSLAAVVFGLTLWILWRSGRVFMAAWRRGILQLDSFVMCLSLLLAALLIAWIYLP